MDKYFILLTDEDTFVYYFLLSGKKLKNYPSTSLNRPLVPINSESSFSSLLSLDRQTKVGLRYNSLEEQIQNRSLDNFVDKSIDKTVENNSPYRVQDVSIPKIPFVDTSYIQNKEIKETQVNSKPIVNTKPIIKTKSPISTNISTNSKKPVINTQNSKPNISTGNIDLLPEALGDNTYNKTIEKFGGSGLGTPASKNSLGFA